MITNKHNLPWYMVNWLSQDDYDRIPGTISATGLIKPIRAVALISKAKKEGIELDSDISDLFAARYGTMIHESITNNLIKNMEGDNVIVEKRYFAELDGYRITGQPDAIIDGVIHDFKSTATTKYMKRDYDDYIKQLSIYKWLMFKNGVFMPEVGVIDFIFTDWMNSKALADSQYPQCRYAKALIHLWKNQETEDWIRNRFREIEAAEVNLPLCSEEELWPRLEKYAHMRPGRKSAVKLYDTLTEAEEGVAVSKAGDYVQHRPGEVKRCNYCEARSICSQYKDLVAQGRISD